MTPKRNFLYLFKKYITILGAFLILSPGGITWVWGNLSVYIYSYFHAKQSNNRDGIKAPWIIYIFLSMWGIGSLAVPYVERLLGRRNSIFVSMLLICNGILSSYFVFESTLDLMNFTIGSVTGFGNGCLMPMVLAWIYDWTEPSEVGLIGSFVLSSYPIGAIITNQLVTHYINPGNLKPNVTVGPTKYFGQEEILHRVPMVFVYYACGFATLSIVGFCMLQKKPPKKEERTSHHTQLESGDVPDDSTENRRLINKGQRFEEYSISRMSTIYDQRLKDDQENSIHYQQSGKLDGNKISKLIAKESLTRSKNSYTEKKANAKTHNECTIKEMLRSKSFYSLWFSLFLAPAAYIVPFNYYKAFGQVWIKDDHFLTNLGTVGNVSVIFARLFWGFLIDRIGVKATLIFFHGSICLAYCSYYFTPQESRWLFFIFTLILFFLSSGMLPSFLTAGLKLFGREQFAAKHGILFTATTISFLSSPPIIKSILNDLGWASLYFVVALCHFIGLVNVFIFLNKR